VTLGTLTNTASGIINANETTVGSRTISADLTNNGQVNIDADTTFFKASGSYVNSNLLNIATGATLTISGSSQTFTQASGVLDIGGTFTLSGMDFAYSGGPLPSTCSDDASRR